MTSYGPAGGALVRERAPGRYATVSGLDMYYEVHGAGRPLVLLHGGLMSIDSTFGRILPSLAQTRQVIGVEQQGHGHTADIDRPLSYEQMADDTAALLRRLQIERADLFGYSDGGIVALSMAIRHPGLVRKLVVAGANYNNDGLYPEVLEFMRSAWPEDMGPEAAELYAGAAPHPEQWPVLFAKEMELGREFAGLSPEALRSIEAPVLVMVGDSDAVRPEHAVELFRLLGGGVAGDIAGLPRAQLAVLPGTTHLSLLERSDWLFSMVTAFLDAPMA